MKTLFGAMALAAALLTLSPAASAQAGFDEGRWYISPMATWVFREDKDRVTNDGFGAHLGVGRGFGDNWAVELSLVGNRLDGIDEVNQWGIGLDLINSFGSLGKWKPYWSIGAGYLKTNTVRAPGIVATDPRDDYDNPFAAVSLGLMRQITDNGLKLRGEVRYRGDFHDPNSYADAMLNVGFLKPLGPPPPPKVVDEDGDGVNDGNDLCPGTPPGAAVDTRGCELDSDRDGVVNSKDACPNTRAGARVDARGCEVQTDSDGDGVADASDKCPNTPRGTTVDAYGCKVIGDADNDGVLDNRDKCPNTARGVRVDVNGCEFSTEIRLPGVQFELNSARLTPASLSVLNDAAATLDKHPEIRVEAQGHTDSSGQDSYNMSLSQRRAEAVRDYLISRGIDAGRITAKGYGETQPVGDNSTAAGRQMNRRVTLMVMAQ
jgi:OOP family OmpA-OmpF porin